jgi:C4-dicarboxylate-specific signal transduction histidine kinase
LNYDSLTHINQLKKIDENLYNLIQPLKPFSNKIIELTNERETKLLTLNATHIKLNNEPLLLIVATNIKNELDNKEIDSWVKLTKVLTHEIMNSIAPITSISETLHDTLKDANEVLKPDELKNTLMGLEVIKQQTKSLQDFVVSYRSFSGISKPQKQAINVQYLLQKMLPLFKTEIETKKIDLKINCFSDKLQIFADENQITQVLFNLIKNAIESLENTADKKITITANTNLQNNVIINVEDNGGGISKELITQIFVPFFSTKKEGSGVGLSLSKHILKMHNGTLTAFSIPNKRTVFTLTF